MLSFLAKAALMVEHNATHSRIRITSDESIKPVVTLRARGFEIFFPHVQFSELAGSKTLKSADWEALWRTAQDSRLASFKVTTRGGVKLVGQWRFPQGRFQLAKPRMEVFSARNHDAFFFDYWIQNSVSSVEQAASQRASAMKNKIQEQEKRVQERASFMVKHEEEKRRIQNATSFCEEKMTADRDIQLHFTPVHESVDFDRWFPAARADSQFHYYEPKKKSRDAQFARLAMTLYKTGKPGLAVKTLDLLQAEFPHSEFTSEMQFLRANCLIRLGLHDAAENILRRIKTDASDAPESLYASMYLAGLAMKRHQPLQGLAEFVWLIEHNGSHSLAWVFHLGAAEALYALGQAERAVAEYHWIIDHVVEGDRQAEAAFRIGDVYLLRHEYDQALAAFSQALTYHAEFQARHPLSLLNMAEALYQLGQYPRARVLFASFYEQHSIRAEGWRATFRMGEIDNRISKNNEELKKSRLLFFDTINSYPGSAGALLARMKLVPCYDHGGIDKEMAQRFFLQEVPKFEQTQKEIATKQLIDFKIFSHVRTLMTLGTATDVYSVVVSEYRAMTDTHFQSIVLNYAYDAFQKMTQQALDEHREFDALSLYSRQAHLLPPVKQLVYAEYMVPLSQAASHLGLGGFGQKILDAYGTIAHWDEIRLSQAHAEPIQKAQSEESFSRAKAMWISLVRSGFEGEKEISAVVRGLLEKSVLDTADYSYQKEIILGLIDERAQHFDAACMHAVKAELLRPSADVLLWHASLEEKSGAKEMALNLYTNIENYVSLKRLVHEKEEKEEWLLGLPRTWTLAQVVLKEGAMHEAADRFDKASEVYGRLVHKYTPDDVGGGIVYAYARSLLKISKRGQALAVLENLVKYKFKSQDKENSFWQKMAQETLVGYRMRQQVYTQ